MVIKALRVISIILLTMWMTLIFMLSSQNAEASSQSSGKTIYTIAKYTYSGFNQLSKPEQEKIVSSYQFVARKLAHFSIYAVLGVLAVLTFITYQNIKYYFRIIFSGVFCLLYAVSDEFHQYFVSGRSCELRDVFIDFSGVVVGMLFILLILKVIKLLRVKRNER